MVLSAPPLLQPFYKEGIFMRRRDREKIAQWMFFTAVQLLIALFIMGCYGLYELIHLIAHLHISVGEY